MNVRIGNDIRLNLTLRGGSQEYGQANIKQLRAYLINTAFKDFGHPMPPHECRRFPNEPYPFYLDVTYDCVHVCGKPGYHMKPWHHPHDHFYHDLRYFGPFPHRHEHHHWLGGCCNNDWACCGCCDSAHVPTPVNPAFGEGCLRPNYGHPEHCHDFAHCHNCCCDVHPVCPMFPSIECDFKYLAPSRVLAEKNRIQVYFPAHAQFACGTYKLVIVLVVYEPGWGSCNLHHYTIDYGNVFTLVDEGGESGDLTIDLDGDEPQPETPTVTSLFVNNGPYSLNSGDTLSIGGTDRGNKVYKIEAELSDNTVITWDLATWKYNPLTFSSSNPSLVAIDPTTGKLTCADTTESGDVTITVTDGTNTYSFIVHVEGRQPVVNMNEGYVGYSSAENIATLVLSDLQYKGNIFGNVSISQGNRGDYIWICSKYNNIEAKTGGMFPVTFSDNSPQKKGDYYCFRCMNQQKGDALTLNISK